MDCNTVVVVFEGFLPDQRRKYCCILISAKHPYGRCRTMSTFGILQAISEYLVFCSCQLVPILRIWGMATYDIEAVICRSMAKMEYDYAPVLFGWAVDSRTWVVPR